MHELLHVVADARGGVGVWARLSTYCRYSRKGEDFSAWCSHRTATGQPHNFLCGRTGRRRVRSKVLHVFRLVIASDRRCSRRAKNSARKSERHISVEAEIGDFSGMCDECGLHTRGGRAAEGRAGPNGVPLTKPGWIHMNSLDSYVSNLVVSRVLGLAARPGPDCTRRASRRSCSQVRPRSPHRHPPRPCRCSPPSTRL